MSLVETIHEIHSDLIMLKCLGEWLEVHPVMWNDQQSGKEHHNRRYHWHSDLWWRDVKGHHHVGGSKLKLNLWENKAQALENTKEHLSQTNILKGTTVVDTADVVFGYYNGQKQKLLPMSTEGLRIMKAQEGTEDKGSGQSPTKQSFCTNQ